MVTAVRAVAALALVLVLSLAMVWYGAVVVMRRRWCAGMGWDGDDMPGRCCTPLRCCAAAHLIR